MDVNIIVCSGTVIVLIMFLECFEMSRVNKCFVVAWKCVKFRFIVYH